jgi:acyl dehydratase
MNDVTVAVAVGGVQLFFEDLDPGMVFERETAVASEDTFSGFAPITGELHPSHSEPGDAANTRSGNPLARGLPLTGCTTLDAAPAGRRLDRAVVALLEASFRFREPVAAGEIVRSTFRVIESRPSASGRQGIVRFAVTMRRANGDEILDGEHTYLVRNRVAA